MKTIAEAATLATNGALIAVDAGDYVGDTALWHQHDLSLRAVGGRVRLIADGRAAHKKGIWVTRGERMSVEGFDFSGARVADRNGAGIRLDRGSLRVVDCSFMHNEMGILANNEAGTMLEVENCEFAFNQRPDGHNHNLYVGRIARLSVRGSYFHHGHIGHLLKSRAALSLIYYNRLTDGSDGSASYELEFPNGGRCFVVGNIIEQGERSENPQIVSFGAERYRWPVNKLILVNNTLIDRLPLGGTFIWARSGATALRVINNLLVGENALHVGNGAELVNNLLVDPRRFAQATDADFRLRAGAPPWSGMVDPGDVNGFALHPRFEYRHPRQTARLLGPATQVGAMQSVAPGS